LTAQIELTKRDSFFFYPERWLPLYMLFHLSLFGVDLMDNCISAATLA
jgi:hypothetical protein